MIPRHSREHVGSPHHLHLTFQRRRQRQKKQQQQQQQRQEEDPKERRREGKKEEENEMTNHFSHSNSHPLDVEEAFDPFDIDIGGGGGGGGNTRQEHRRHQTPPPPSNRPVCNSSTNTPSPSFDGRGGSRKSRSLTPPRTRNDSSNRTGRSTEAGNSDGGASRYWKNPFFGARTGSSSNKNNNKSSGTTNGGTTTTTTTATPPSKKLSSYVGMGTACLLPEELKFLSTSAGQQRQLQDYEEAAAAGAAATGLAVELVCDGQMFVSGISLDPYLMMEESSESPFQQQLDDDDDVYGNDRRENNNESGVGGRGLRLGSGDQQQAQQQQELGFELSFSDLINNNSSSTRTFSPRMVLSSNPFTDAVRPFENSLPISSGYLHDELLEHDYAFQHATMNCGQCWQSIVSQHVRMPTLWWWTNTNPNPNKSSAGEYDFDLHEQHQLQQQEYGRPPLGSPEPFNCPWLYIVNNTIRGHPLLIRHIPNARSPGVILLHLMVRSYKTVVKSQHHHNSVVLCDLEDVVVGCYHPVHHRMTLRSSGGRNGYDFDENIRHVWISHRSRRSTTNATTGNKQVSVGAAHRQGNSQSSLLYMYLHQHQTMKDGNMYTNPFLVDTSSSSNNHHDPKHHRMNTNDQKSTYSAKNNNNNDNRHHDRAINNDNLRYIFGDRPPLSTIIVTEQEMLHVFDESQRRNIPPSVMLLEKYLWSPNNNNRANTKSC